MLGRFLLSLSLLWSSCCLCGDARAQAHVEVVAVAAGEPIKLEKLDQFVWGGFEGARVVDGKVIAKVTSKPKFESTTSQIILTLGEGYEVAEIIAESDEDYIDLDETPLDGGKVELTFPPDTPEGIYKIEVRANKEGVSRQAVKRLKVKIGGDGPAPPDIDPDLPALSKEARKAMQGLVAGMADDMDKAAIEVEGGRITKVLDLAAFTVPLDVATRNVFKKSLAGPLEAALGKDALTPSNAKALREVAVGFRSVK